MKVQRNVHFVPRERPDAKHSIYDDNTNDAGAALAPMLSGGTSAHRWQSAHRL